MLYIFFYVKTYLEVVSLKKGQKDMDDLRIVCKLAIGYKREFSRRF